MQAFTKDGRIAYLPINVSLCVANSIGINGCSHNANTGLDATITN